MRFHSRAMSRAGYDSFVNFNLPVNTSFTNAADMQLTNETWRKWESALLFASTSLHSVDPVIWPLIHDPQLLERALSIRRVTWDVSEESSSFHVAFRFSIGRVFCYARKTVKCIAKGLIAARLPHRVEEAEVDAFLPTTAAQFSDVCFQIWNSALPLSLVCSLCARHLEKKEQATTYAKAELTGNLNPLKLAMAHMALGVAGCLEGEAHL